LQKGSLFPEIFIPQWRISVNFILNDIKSNWDAGFTCVSLGALKNPFCTIIFVFSVIKHST